MTAGINLALLGYSVVIYDKGPEVGHRHHGDFQALENYSSHEEILDSLSRMNLPGDFLKVPFKTLDILDKKLNLSVIESKRAGLYLIKRGTGADTLDQAFKRRAVEVGVGFQLDHPIDPAKADIVATGPRRAMMAAAGINFRSHGPERIALLLSHRVTPGGYSYLALADGWGTVGAVLFDRRVGARRALEGAVQAFQKVYDLNISDPRPFSGRGDFFLAPSYSDGKRLFVGEAAGLQDYWLGFGIRYALISGHLAARALAEGREFNRLLKESGIIAQARASLSNRFIFELMGKVSHRWLINRWAGADDIIEFMRESVNPSLLKSLLYPLAKWALKGRLGDGLPP